MDSIADTSPRQLARIAGALYLINIVAGAFAIGIVPATLVVSGDAAATAKQHPDARAALPAQPGGARRGHRDQCAAGAHLLRAVQGGEPKACPAGRVLDPGRDRR